VLSGSAGLFERSLSGGQHPRLCRRFIREQACEIFYDETHVSEELVDDVYAMLSDRVYRRFLLKVAKATRNRYMLEELARVKVPTLIVWDATTRSHRRLSQNSSVTISPARNWSTLTGAGTRRPSSNRRVCARAARFPRRHDVGGLPGEEAAVGGRPEAGCLGLSFERGFQVSAIGECPNLDDSAVNVWTSNNIQCSAPSSPTGNALPPASRLPPVTQATALSSARAGRHGCPSSDVLPRQWCRL